MAGRPSSAISSDCFVTAVSSSCSHPLSSKCRAAWRSSASSTPPLRGLFRGVETSGHWKGRPFVPPSGRRLVEARPGHLEQRWCGVGRRLRVRHHETHHSARIDLVRPVCRGTHGGDNGRRRTGRRRSYEKATFAGGCFWCMEPPFDELPGVVSTTSGYTGGRTKNPTYEEVSAGGTGHAEAVEVTYDPAKITYAQLLDVFWKNIDPIMPNRQFCDVGTQYRAADLLSLRGAETTGGSVKESAGRLRPFQAADRHRDRGRLIVLPGRGIPSGLLQEEPDPLQLLQVQLRTRPAARGAVGQVAIKGRFRPSGPDSRGRLIAANRNAASRAPMSRSNELSGLSFRADRVEAFVVLWKRNKRSEGRNWSEP